MKIVINNTRFLHYVHNYFNRIICIYLMYQPVKNALQTIGSRGKYQKLLVVFLFFIAAQVNYLVFGPTFIFMNPLFQCTFTNQLVDQSIACEHLSQCKISTDFTIVAAAQLYCDKQVDRNIIQSIAFLGAITGLLAINYISDLKGRKFAMLIAQAVAILGISMTILGGYTASTAILIISQFLCGFSGYSMIIMAYIIPSQYCDDDFRQKLIIIINYAWASTVILIGVLYYYYNQWYNYLILFILIPMVGVFLISTFYLVEGPNFLYGAKRQKECLQSLREIAVYNDTLKYYDVVAENFKYQSSEVKDKKGTQNLKQVLKNAEYRKLFISLMLVDIGGTLYYIGTNFALDQIGLEYGANMISSGLIEFAAFIVLHLTITKIPRRKGLIATYGTMAFLGLLFFIKPLQESHIGSLIIVSLCRFLGTISYTVLVMMLTESFPMKVQSICAGIIESVAQLGGFLGPIIITICINYQVYPVIVLSFVIILIIVIPLCMISDKKIPDEEVVNETLISSTAEEQS